MTMTHVGGPFRVGDYFGPGVQPGGQMDNIAVYNVVPATIDADGIAAAQAVLASGNLTLNGALASGGTVTLDVPRAVQIVSDGAGDTTQTATVSGYDVYNQPMTETIAFNGVTPVLGTKAFKRVTQVAISAALAGLGSAGSTDVFGLPYVLGSLNYCLAVKWAGAIADVAATVVAADTTSPATATTDDVRGTVTTLGSASDGSRRLTVYQYLPPSEVNGTRTGIYGVTQA